MRVGYVFVVVWGVVAIGLGLAFVLKPDAPAQMYIDMMARFRTTNRMRESLAPRSVILVVYRIGGVFCIVLGVVVPVLVFTGVIPMTSR